MSTTVIMETFDTQMFDSGDADIPMYTGAGSSEPWLSVEATMADEGNNAEIQYYRSEQSVEIEMADHDDEITEYEMADEQEYNDAEVVDIDLVDVSRQASPPPGVPTLSVPKFPLGAPSSYERGLSLASFGYSVDSAHDAPANEVVEHPIVPYIIDTAASATLPETNSKPPDEHATNVGEVLQQVPAAAESASFTHPAEVRVPEEASTADAVAVNGEVEIAPELVTAEEPQDAYTAEARDRGEHSSNPQQADSLPSPPPTSSLLTEQVVAPAIVPPETEAPQASHPDAGTAYGQEIVEAEAVESDVQGADPHEISEGVYIDPPPAVLLAVSSSAQPLDCCLFNRPIRTPGSQSPSTSSAAEHSLRLLMHHRPTLYYEPLSTVFEALRQEEHIQGVYDLERDELVLDAYDLQLVIPEDNVHVQEVTLHDLNVLHDGADLTGPLRLELRAMPRFIARYNALRDQIARLDLAAEDEQAYEAAYERHSEEEHLSVHSAEENSNQTHREQEEERETEQHEQRQPGEPEALSHEQEQEQYDATQTSDGHVSKSTQQEVPGAQEQEVPEPQQNESDGAQDDDAPYESDEYPEHVDENAPNGGGDVLDADEVHSPANAEEGGDYLDQKDVAPEDDEQQFGEDLSEELGGEPGGDAEEREAFDDVAEGDADSANPVSSEGIDVLETPAFLAGDFTTIPGDQYGDEQRDEDGLTDTGETLPTDMSAPAQEENELLTTSVENVDDLEEYDGEPTSGGVEDNSPASRPDDADDEWTFESFDDPIDVPSAEHELSRKPSTMSSSSRSSKRGHDEVDVVDEEESYPQSSPDVKKARIQ